MNTRRVHSRRIHQLLVGTLGMSVMFAGTVLPVAAAEPPASAEVASAEPVVLAEPVITLVEAAPSAQVVTEEASNPPPSATEASPTPTPTPAATPAPRVGALAEAPFAVTGTVQTASGNPLVGATVRLTGGGVSGQATTDAGGNYSLSAVSGPHTLELYHNGSSAQAQLTVDAANPTIELTVPDLVGVNVRVHDVNDLPVWGASVKTSGYPYDALKTFQIVPGVWATGSASLTTTTDTAGLAHLVSFPVASYRDVTVTKAFDGYNATLVLHNIIPTATPSTVDAGLSGQVAPPGPPRDVRASDFATGYEIAYVSWSTPSTYGGAPVTAYTATVSPGGASCTTGPNDRHCAIYDLPGGRTYDITVTATNVAGTGASSTPVKVFISAKPTPPTPPTDIAASPGVNQVEISWSPPTSDGGRPVTNYYAAVFDATSAQRWACQTTGQLSCTVGDLGYGEYTVTVMAMNEIGWSDDSDATAPFLVETPPPTATLVPSGRSTNDIYFHLAMSETVSGLTASDLTVGGSASGCQVRTIDYSWWHDGTVVVSGCTDGDVSLTLEANSVFTTAGKPGPATAVSAIGEGLDRVRPSTPKLTAALRTGASLSGSAVPIRLTWTASTDTGTGLAAKPYELYRSYCGGPLVLIGTYAGTTANVNQTTTNCSTEYLVRSTDAAGNMSDWGRQDVMPSLRQPGYARLAGAWSTTKSSKFSGGSTKVAKVAGPSVSYDVSGRTISLVATKGATKGRLKVYVNGTYQGTVDLRANATQYRTIVWQKSWSSQAARTLKLVAAGTSGRPTVDIDAFVELS